MPGIRHIRGPFAAAALVAVAAGLLILPADRSVIAAPAQDADVTKQDSGQGAAQPPAAAKARRVVLQTGRDTFVSGTIESENDSVITIDEGGEIRSFIKSRLLNLTYLVDPQPGQRGMVVLTDGSRREGVIISDAYDSVLLEIGGIRSRIDRSVVRRVELIPTVRERYEMAKASLQPAEVDRRFELARWLVSEAEFVLARDELESLVADGARIDGLQGLLRQVNAQIALKEGTLGGTEDIGRTDTEESAGDRGPVDQRELLPDELLSREDVNLIRVYEIDFRDPPQINITPDTIRTLITDYASHKAIPADSDARSALFRADPTDLVRLMFEVRARDLYSQIEVLTEPYALNLFRQRVHDTWLIKNCATSRCHGGVDGGRFFLHNTGYRDERVRYTNLLILERLHLEGKPPLVNYESPTDSLIYQHALPVTEARHAHPDVVGWRPALGAGQRTLRDDFVKWVKAMYQPRPEYPVSYEPPRLIGEDQESGDGFGRGREDR